MKSEVHVSNFSEVLTRAVCGGTIYLEIIREASQIFYGINPISAGSVLLTSNIIYLKRENHEPIITVKIIE